MCGEKNTQKILSSSKSQYLSLFDVFFFSTKYFIIFGKVADQGHRGLLQTKDRILYIYLT